MHFELEEQLEKKVLMEVMESDSTDLYTIKEEHLHGSDLNRLMKSFSRTPIEADGLKSKSLRLTMLETTEEVDANGKRVRYLKDNTVNKLLLSVVALKLNKKDHTLYLCPAIAEIFRIKEYSVLAKAFPTFFSALAKEGALRLALDEGDENRTFTKEEASFMILKASLPTSNPEAYTELGRCYELGRGVNRDYNEARAAYLAGIRRGSSESMFYYIDSLIINSPVMASTKDEVLELQARAKLNDKDALVDLGRMYRDGIYFEADLAKALDYFKRASSLNSQAGAAMAGLFYLYGANVDKSSKAALEYFSMLDDELATKHYLLGKLYANKDNKEYSIDKALDCFKKALELGLDEAAYDVAQEYLYKNMKKEALEVLRIGSEKGNEEFTRQIKRLNKNYTFGYIDTYDISNKYNNVEDSDDNCLISLLK